MGFYNKYYYIYKFQEKSKKTFFVRDPISPPLSMGQTYAFKGTFKTCVIGLSRCEMNFGDWRGLS